MRWKAVFPMYNVSARIHAGYAAWFDALLAELRADGFTDPVDLLPDAPSVFGCDDLLLGQTCGYPYLTLPPGRLQLVATPAYDFPGCQGSDYASAFVVRADGGIATLEQARGRIAAANETDSNSGMNALRHAVAPLAQGGRFFSAVRWSGSHRASLALLRQGGADLAAIDCVTLGYLARERPEEVAGLTVIGYSAPSPGLPMVAGPEVPDPLLRQLRALLLTPRGQAARALAAIAITRFEHLDDAAYARILVLEAEARASGYPQLA